MRSERVAVVRELRALLGSDAPALALAALDCCATPAVLATVPPSADEVTLAAIATRHAMTPPAAEEALLRAFRALDKAREGTLLAEEMLYNLGSFGDKLLAHELDELAGLLTRLAPGAKAIDYVLLAKHISRAHRRIAQA